MNVLSPAPVTPGDRSLPHNLEAEQALLGAILTNNKALDRVVEFLRPEHFYSDVHAHIFATARQLVDKGKVANPITLKGSLESDGALDVSGGMKYIAELARAATTIINAQDYGRIVRDLADRRALIQLCEETIEAAHGSSAERTAANEVEALEAGLSGIAFDSAFEGGPVHMNAILQNVIATADLLQKTNRGMTGVPTGFRALDRATGGLRRGFMYILGGRPSMGKSTLAQELAHHVASLPVSEWAPAGAALIFSLEMTGEQSGVRYLAARSDVANVAIISGRLGMGDFDRMVNAQIGTQSIPLYVDETPGLTVSAIRARARRMKRKQGLRLLVIDHLGLITSSGGENRNVELGQITAALKRLAKELDCPIVLLSQLSRKVEEREDKRPLLSDLRESGNIEQDADVVMFVFREQYYLERAEPRQRADESPDRFNDRHNRYIKRLEEVWNTAEVNLAKNREGPLATVRLQFHGDKSRFDNLVQPENDGGEG